MFKIEDELKMFDQLKYEGCEEPMSKEKAHDFYIPISQMYFSNKAKGDNSDETEPKILREIRDSFYTICSRLKAEELDSDFLGNSEKVAKFYRHRGKMLGIDTSFIDEHMTGGEIFNDWIDAYWEKVKVPILNPALGEYMFASRAKDSDLFWCFLIGSAGYLAIETAYRWGFDPVGVYRQATLGDPLSLWTYRDEAYLYQKWRDYQFLNQIIEVDNILTLGAGGMPELRHTGYFKEFNFWRDQKIYACDPDPRIDFDFLMNDSPFPSRKSVDYRNIDMLTMLKEMKEEGKRFDLIYVKGVISFMKEALGPLAEASLELLNTGGKFIFDMQLKHFAMARDACIFGWGGGDSKVKIELLSLDDALEFIEQTMQKNAWSKDLLLPYGVFKDPFYGDPFGINAAIKKY